METLDTSRTFERIYVKDSLHGDFEKVLRAKCRDLDIPLKRVPQVKLDQLSRSKNHQGVVGVTSLIEYQKVNDIIPFIFEKGMSPTIVMIDNVQDIRNVGAISRSCEVLGAHALILSGKNAATINHDAIKTSSGALTRMPICKEKNTIDVIQQLKSFGMKVLGTGLQRGDFISTTNLKPPVVVVLGSEQSGLHHSTLNACDQIIQIPQQGQIDSLNISVAAGIILYEIARQANLNEN